MVDQQENNDDNDAELVSEFPPPPYYYAQASTLQPPPIPHGTVERCTRKTVAMRKAKEIEDRARLSLGTSEGDVASMAMDTDGTGMALGGVVPDFDQKIGEAGDGPIVTVFGDESYLEVSLFGIWLHNFMNLL